MKLPSIAIIWSTGIAIFSMFFGSGNVVFPLLLGKMAGDQVGWALVGLTITAVGAPLLGLLSCVLFEGDCKRFFYRIGAIPGYLVVLLILGLLGPFCVMPRCFVVAYASVKPYFPNLSLMAFSFFAGGVTLLLIARRNLILPLLGFWLSPVLIGILLGIIGVAIFNGESLQPTGYTPVTAVVKGLAVGYNTMDLLASLLFSVSIWRLLKSELHDFSVVADKEIKQKLIPTYIWASLIGGGFLGLIYVGMSVSAALHPMALAHTAPEQVLSALAIYLLGPKLAIAANIAIFLACITTVMSMAVAVVDVVHLELRNTKIGKQIPHSYGAMMLATILLTVIFANLGFQKIMNSIAPILELCYPAIIVLAICNILYKLKNFAYVKIPFYGTLALTILYQVIA